MSSSHRVADHLRQEIRAARKSTRRIVIGWGLSCAVALALLFVLLAHLPPLVAHPGWIAELVEDEVGAALPGVVKNAKQRLVDSAPQLTKRIRRQIVRTVPDIAAEVVGDAARYDRRVIADIKARPGEIIDAALAASDTSIDKLAAAETKPTSSQLRVLEQELTAALDASFEPRVAGEADQLPDTTAVLDAVAHKVDRIAAGDGLTPEEFLLRQVVEHAIAVLLAEEPTDR
jgi:hypothetical protein